MPRQPILSVLGHVDSGKCVAPETKVQLADGSKVPAEDLFKKYRSKGKKVDEEEGEVYELENGVKTFGVEDGKYEAAEIEKAWKLEKDELIEIKTSDGSELKVTPEHPFLSFEDGELKFKEAGRIEEEDFVAVPEELPVENIGLKQLKVRTLKELGKNRRMLCFVSEELSSDLYEEGKELENALLTNHLYDCKENDRYRAKDLVKICDSSEIEFSRAYQEIKEVKQSTLKQRAGSTSKRIDLPRSMDQFEDLAYAAGLMLGDGGSGGVLLHNNSQPIKKQFEEAIESSIATQTLVRQRENRADVTETGAGKSFQVLLETLFDYPEEDKSYRIKLSNYALSLPENVLANLISGYMDADGYVSKKGTIIATSASQEMVEDLKTALKRFGIEAYIKEKDGYYKVHLSGKKNLRNFSEIGFRKREKQQRYLENLERSAKNPVTGKTPVSGQEVAEARQQLGASHTEIDIPYQKKYESYGHVSKSYLQKFVEQARETRQSKEYRLNLEEKTRILESLKQWPKTREEVYEEMDIEHPRLLNHVLSLESENLIREKNEVLEITGEGEKMLEFWKNETAPALESLEKLAGSELSFVQVEQKKREEGGTVYDFTTELETFTAEDLIVHNTTLLDRIRESRIVEGEEGGITQMIGATEVPLDTVEDMCGGLLDQLDVDVDIPGVLFIDTPGHAAFSSLRKRGGSIADIAVLVIDVEEGVQPQTEEAIEILKESGTPFIIAFNKVDLIHGWNSREEKSFLKCIREQPDRVQEDLDNKIYDLMAELNEFDITVDRFDRVDDFRKKVAVVPMSAETGEGIPELLMVVSGLAQRYLADNLEVEEGVGKGTVLEVSEEEGLGTTIDVIHYDGVISKEDKLVYGTPEGAKTTEIRALLEPRPLKEIRKDKKYNRVEKIEPASGVKVAGKDLEGVISGAPIRSASEEELEEAREEVEEELEAGSYKTQNFGVVAKADSLGSLEALMRVLEEEEIPVQKAEVGKVTKTDVVEVQNEDPENRAILAFNTKLNDQAATAVESEGIEVFQSGVIYEIVDGYTEWKQELKQKQRQNALTAISRPARIRVLQGHVFRSSNPAVVGVKVVEGVLKPDTYLMTPDGEKIGRVKSVQENKDSLDKAEKGAEVAASITSATVGRDFEEGDVLLTDIDGTDYQRLQELEDLLSAGEKDVLEEVVDVKDSIDPHWKLG